MTRKLLTLATLAGALVIGVMVATPAAAQDPGPISGALATLSAATAQAQAVRAAQQATRTAAEAIAIQQQAQSLATARALSAEATAQAFAVQSTAQAQNAQATQSAMDELTRQRAATATAQAMNIAETRTAQEATATAQVMNARATATSQAVMIAAQATDTARLSATYATRQDRFTWGLLAVEILFLCGAAWVLWKLSGTLSAWAVRMRPTPGGQQSRQAQPVISEVVPAGNVVIEQAPEPEPRTPGGPRVRESRLPDFVQVVDNPAMVEALDKWAERYDARYDAERGGDNANTI